MLFDQLQNYTTYCFGLFCIYALYLVYNDQSRTIGYAFMLLSGIFFVTKPYQYIVILVSIMISYIFSQLLTIESFQDEVDYNCVELKMKYEETLDAKDVIIKNKDQLIANRDIEIKTLTNNINRLQSESNTKQQNISQLNTQLDLLTNQNKTLKDTKRSVFNMSKL